MTPEDAERKRNEFADSLLARGTLTLTVSVATMEQGMHLMEWLYGEQDPRRPTLRKIDWALGDGTATVKTVDEQGSETVWVEQGGEYRSPGQWMN